MKATIINLSKKNVNKTTIVQWVKKAGSVLEQNSELLKILPKSYKICEKHINIVFVPPPHIRKLNKTFRGKDRVTDILSFSCDIKKTASSAPLMAPLNSNTLDTPILGELVLCLTVIKQTATTLSYQLWLYYLILHGMLHLLGLQHEFNLADSKIMYRIQDTSFAKLINSISNQKMRKQKR